MDKRSQGMNYQRLILGFGIIISFFLGFGLFALTTIHNLSHLTTTIYNHPLVVSNASLQANALITKMHRNMKDVVLSNSKSDMDKFVRAVNEEELNVYKHLEIVKSKILGEEGQQLEKIARNRFENWKSIRNEVIHLVGQDNRAKAAAMTLGKGANYVESLEKNMQGLTHYAREKASDFITQQDKEYKKAKTILILFLVSGIMASLIISFFTLTQSQKTGKILESSEKRYRSLIETQTDLVSRFEPDGKFTFVNQIFCNFFNKSRDELLNGDWKPLPVEEDIEYVQSKIASLSIKNPTVVIENKVRTETGDIFWMQFVNQAFFDNSEKLIEIQSVGRDITAQKHHENQIEHQNLILDSINRTFIEAINCRSVKDVAKTCLDIALEITNSKFGSIAEVNKAGHFDTLALNHIDPDHGDTVQDMKIEDIWVDAYKSKNGIICNAPGKHPDSFSIPEGHPPLNSFIGIPLNHTRLKGVIGLTNKEGGYTEDDKSLLQTLAFSFAEAIEKKRATLALIASEERYKTQFQMSSDAIFLVEIETLKFLDANEAAIVLYGYSREELIQMKATDLSAEKVKTKKAIQKNHDASIPMRYHKKKDGTVFPVEIMANNITLNSKEINISSIRDITDRIESEKQIKRSLKEKEILLKEIHHRVKNNMQVIQSLLSLQLNSTKNPEQKKLLIDSGNRIKSMALIHETLYGSEDIAHLDIKTYFDNIVQHLFKIYNKSNIHVEINVDIQLQDLNLDCCIACGLILNELISNALKYAFENTTKGNLAIFLNKADEKNGHLIVKDDGCGLPADFDIEGFESLGLKIVRILVQGQLNGHLIVTSENGAIFEIKFPFTSTE